MGRHSAYDIYHSIDGWLMNDEDDMIDPAFNAYLQAKFDDVEAKRITRKQLKNIIYDDLDWYEGKNKLFNEELCEMFWEMVADLAHRNKEKYCLYEGADLP